MSFCPECGKPATAEATSCASCGYAFEAKPAAGKQGAARFKGTMLMTPSAVVAKPATQAAAAAAPAPGASPIAAATPQAPATSPKAEAKMTMIGTGVNVPAAPAARPQPAAAVQPAQIAVKAAAIAAPVAQPTPIAQPAPATQVATPAPLTPAAKPAPVASAAKPAAQPPLSLSLGVGDRAADPLANTDPPDALARAGEDNEVVHAREPKYLPGDPMAPQPTAARAPMLRYDSRPSAPRGMDPEKRWLWIAAGVIVIACLGLVIVIASRMH